MISPVSRSHAHAIFVLMLAGALSACGGGSGGGGTTTPPPPPPPPPSFGPNFSEIQANVFTPTCAVPGCHISAVAPQGLQLDVANSYANLVGVMSSEDPAFLRVNPGNPDASYIIQKLEGTASAGGQMPLGRTPLSASTIATMRQWISDGAIDDRAGSTGPIRVASIAPQSGSILAASPMQIVIGFDRDPDASTVNAMTFLLEASGGDQTFGDNNEVPVMATLISVPMTNTRSAVFDLSGVTLADETYRVRLLGSGASLLLDMDSNALDGEFTGMLPSGDGTAGGDFEVEFTVTTPPAPGTTLDEIQMAVFSPTCSSSTCHSGPVGMILPNGMNLTSADNSFANLVDVDSLQNPTIKRVAPFDPDGSYLIQKLEGTAPGAQMPFGGTPLDPAVISNIRTWISNGAER